MIAAVLGTWVALVPPIETRLVPLSPAGPGIQRSMGVGRAVVLLHGFKPRTLSAKAALSPELSQWEQPDTQFVKSLAAVSDVYAFCFAQVAAVDVIGRHPALAEVVRELRYAGYLEVVLIGYSAGGLVARAFVESAPGGGGVTKVIQVCTPNRGTEWGRIGRPAVVAAQRPFVASLAKSARSSSALARLPDGVEFVCVVGVLDGTGDGLVRRDSQWPADLQAQGVPAEVLMVPHVAAMYWPNLTNAVVKLVGRPCPRWSAEEVARNRSRVLGWWAGRD